MNVTRNFIVSRDDNDSILPSPQLLTRSSQVQILQQEEGAFRIWVPPRPGVGLCLALDPSAQQKAEVDGTEGRVDAAVCVWVMWLH